MKWKESSIKSCNNGSNYGMILSDSEIFTSGSPLTSAGFGAGVCLTLTPQALLRSTLGY